MTNRTFQISEVQKYVGLIDKYETKKTLKSHFNCHTDEVLLNKFTIYAHNIYYAVIFYTILIETELEEANILF